MFIFFSAGIPIYMSAKVKKDLKSLTIALSVFIVIHGVYHILAQFGFTFLSETVFEPLSIVALIGFGLMYLTKRNKQRVVKNG
jgi:hypothetical protein